MAPRNSSPKSPASSGSPRWSTVRSSPARPNRLTFRLIGIPVIAVAGVLFYSGLRDHFILPSCDSARAKRSLADVFKELKYEPLDYKPIQTISSSKDAVVCQAILPLPDGASLNVDYSFFWQGSKANMKYSVSRQSPPNPAPHPPDATQ